MPTLSKSHIFFILIVLSACDKGIREIGSGKDWCNTAINGLQCKGSETSKCKAEQGWCETVSFNNGNNFDYKCACLTKKKSTVAAGEIELQDYLIFDTVRVLTLFEWVLKLNLNEKETALILDLRDTFLTGPSGSLAIPTILLLKHVNEWNAKYQAGASTLQNE